MVAFALAQSPLHPLAVSHPRMAAARRSFPRGARVAASGACLALCAEGVPYLASMRALWLLWMGHRVRGAIEAEGKAAEGMMADTADEEDRK